MSSQMDQFQASRELLAIMMRHVQLLEKQLSGIRVLLEHFMSSIMTGVEQISRTTTSKSSQARDFLEQTYLDPDVKVQEFISEIQKSAEALISGGDLSQEEVFENRKRRFAGLFSKHMEVLSTVDDELSALLFRIMGALSNDDVISQRLDHLSLCIHSFYVSLSSLLIDFENRFSVAEIKAMRKAVLVYSFQCYSSEEERQIFLEIFPRG